MPLVVLNGSSRVGLAERAAARFEAGGWMVASTGNLTGDIASTCAYYDPAGPGAEAAGRALRAQFPTINRVARKVADLPAGPIVVVLSGGLLVSSATAHCARMDAQPNSTAHPEGQRDRPDEAPATTRDALLSY